MLNEMSERDFAAFADCAGLQVGIHKLKVQLGKNTSIKLLKGASIRVVVREKEEQQEFVTPQPVQTVEPTEEPEETEAPSEEPEEEEEG